MVFHATFNSMSVISRRQLMLFMVFLGFTSTRLGSEVSCPRTLPQKNPEDPVQFEPRTPGLQVKNFTTEPRGTLWSNWKHLQMKNLMFLNFLPNDKMLDWSKLKAFAEDKINVNERLKFGLGEVENIVAKGENAGYLHILLFITMFSKGFFSRLV